MSGHSVETTTFPSGLAELYRCASGPAEAVEPHAHEAYQICLPFGVACAYRYRGEDVLVPKETPCVLHPGETHSTRDAEDRPPGVEYRMLYLSPPTVSRMAAEIGGHVRTEDPYFPKPVVRDPDVVAGLRGLHGALEAGADALTADSMLVEAISRLVFRHAQNCPGLRRIARFRPELRRTREFLHDHPGRSVSLDELTEVAGLSKFHLSRAFREEFGLPPYAYHLRVRVGHARELIARGMAPALAAREAGFDDQSRFGRHFRRVVGVTPGRYGSKNRLYTAGKGEQTLR